MEIIDDTIFFKSSALFYELEQSDKKRNTVRLLNEEEYNKLSDWINGYSEKWITISENDSPVITFLRKLTDISCISKEILFNNYIYVFSW